MSRLLACCAAFLIVPFLPAFAADTEKLDKGEIAAELVGKQIVWWEAAGWRHGYLMLLPNGMAEMTVDRPRRQHDLGRWSLHGDKVCTRWGEMRGGTEKCYSIGRAADGRFITTGGNVFEVRELGV